MNYSNPIVKEFTKLNLVKKKNLSHVGFANRGIKVKVFKDIKSNIYLLEKNKISKNYYLNDRKMNFNELRKYLKTLYQDDKRRFNQFKHILNGKKIIDFGCEYGGFLELVKRARKKYGVELNQNCRQYIKKKSKNTQVFERIDEIEEKVDVITLFHVLEHLPYQVNFLKHIKNKLKKGGKLIVEIPSANDILLSLDELVCFKKFTFWHEHLVLHTIKSLKKILSQAGYKKIKIIKYQRYNLDNHLGWFLENKPGGHIFFKNLTSESTKKNYNNYLVDNSKTDTLIAIATN
jgi:2-polyprenyl-3-methyl-5-hydroxy-6-metoxy-1,4-benzoquinol methylase